MKGENTQNNQTILGKLIPVIFKLPSLDVLNDLSEQMRKLVQHFIPKGMYEVLDYESTLELIDQEGKEATIKKREKIRYLQDNVIAYQDQAWGDGKTLINYRCTPGKPVDCYRLGHKWHILISRREVKNKGDIDDFNIEWEIRNSFLKPTGYWETHITHSTEHLRINVIFPKTKPPKHVTLTESNRQRSYRIVEDNQTLLPDGRCLVTWETPHARLYENYILQWEW